LMARPALTDERLVISRSQLMAQTGLSVELVRRFERVGLVSPVAKSAREVYYATEALQQMERVQTLMAAGYAERDIAHVVGRVASPELDGLVKVDEVDAVAIALGVDEGVLDGLSRRGVLVPWGRTHAGAALVAKADIALLGALVALVALGLDASVEDYVAAHRGDVSPEAIADLRARIQARIVGVETAASAMRKALSALARRGRGSSPTLARLLAGRATGERGWGGRRKKGAMK